MTIRTYPSPEAFKQARVKVNPNNSRNGRHEEPAMRFEARSAGMVVTAYPRSRV